MINLGNKKLVIKLSILFVLIFICLIMVLSLSFKSNKEWRSCEYVSVRSNTTTTEVLYKTETTSTATNVRVNGKTYANCQVKTYIYVNKKSRTIKEVKKYYNYDDAKLVKKEKIYYYLGEATIIIVRYN